jgi:putative FmdB family regulatory protein
MPTYEYVCNNCGFAFEEFQSIAAEPLHVCPRCKGKVRRLISGGGGIIFKGTGFYETDYKRKHFSEPTPSVDRVKEKAETKTTTAKDKKKTDTAKK